MTHLRFIIILFWMGFFSPSLKEMKAQDIIWEKQWGYAPGGERIEKICPAANGTFFATGYSTKFRKDTLGSTYFYTLLIKFDQNGDTLWMKRLNVLYGYTSFLGHKFGNIYQAALLTQSTWVNYIPVLIEFTEDGIILETKYFTQFSNYLLNDGFRTPDGGLLFPGTGIGPGTNQSVFKFNFLNELEWSYAYFPPVTIAGFGQRIEPMANGHYLLSGILGKRIYGFELDSSGNEVSQKQFYETPTNMVFDGGFASQLWRKRTLAFGQFDQNGTRKVAMFCFDSLGNKIWGGERNGNSGPVFINRELSFIHTGTEDNFKYIARISADSSTIWKINLGSFSENRAVVSDLCFTQNDTGIIAGTYIHSQGNQGFQFWLVKIAGVGTAYDPTNPGDTVTVSAQEKLFRPKDSPVLFPNPTTETIRFTKLTQETLLAIYSSTGKKLFEKAIMPDEYVDVCHLPHGAYLYHLKMGERVFTGKFLKR